MSKGSMTEGARRACIQRPILGRAGGAKPTETSPGWGIGPRMPMCLLKAVSQVEVRGMTAGAYYCGMRR